MSLVALDTSVLVAAIQSWHVEHARALVAVARTLENRRAVVPFHVLLETYSVLSRMPRPLRLSARDAFSALDQTLQGKAKVVDLGAPEAFDLLKDFRDRGITGGAVYDAMIAEAALRAGAQSLLTLNRNDFDRVAPAGLEVVEP